MPWGTVFANLTAGNQPLSLLDAVFNLIANMLILPTTATGTNAIVLSPLSSAPTLAAYVRYNQFRFKAAASSTGAVTIQYGSLAPLPAYKKDGTTQIGSGDILINQEYVAVFDTALNAGGGGFFLEDAAQGTAGGGGFTPIVPTWQAFTANATVTIPTGATKVKVTLVGGGGGGGGISQTTGGCSPTGGFGGPGGPAGVLVKYLSGLSAGNTLALTVGAGGAAGSTSGGNGGNGGDTTLASGTQTITTLTAGKGSGGGGVNGAVGGAGAPGASGGGTNGDVNFTGTTGYANTTSNLCVSGETGMGFGPSNYAPPPTATGTNAVGFGGGGSGGSSSSGNGAKAGGTGSGGLAIFEWYT